MQTINVFKVGQFEYGVIEGEGGNHIVVDSDFCHYVCKPGEISELYAGDGSYIGIDLPTMKATSRPVTISEFGHYWGIKSRVCTNYHLLLNTMLEMNIDAVTDMPKWGEKAQAITQ